METGAAGRRRQSRAPPAGGASIKLETALIERLPVPKQVSLFEQFEELSKIYAIEAPYLARSQIELAFDLYDGRKLASTGSIDGDNEPQGSAEDLDQATYLQQTAVQQQSGRRHDQTKCKRLAGGSERPTGALSWCRLLLSRGQSRPSSLYCCLKGSETSQDFCLTPATSSSSVSLLPFGGCSPMVSNDALSTAAMAHLVPGHDDEPDEAELKAEVLELIRPLAGQLRRNSRLASVNLSQLDPSIQPMDALEQQQQLFALESALESGQVSVCLLDKRHRSKVRFEREAELGRRWAKFESRLNEMRVKFSRTGSISTSLAVQQQQTYDGRSSAKLERQLDRLVKRRLKPCYKDKGTPRLVKCSAGSATGTSAGTAGGRAGLRAKISRQGLADGQVERLVELAKTSLNHLIDAQLMLRNKLTSEQQQSGRTNEYELLLRNNFNLLKIWQNLEETKHLACFVCEPIKATLADLFWFSRRLGSSGGSGASGGPSGWLLASPLVSQDPIQVKRGLLQILEALHYLHAICKLIHRNLSPRNILIGANDNWKLSGLEFAIRFESANISESASIMGHESSLLRYSSGAGVQAALRRQRTLHQTKCDEFVKRPKGGSSLLQPELDYLAPEIWKSAKCSHKSDLFSYGLILGQTYDLWRHKSPIRCHSQAQNYEAQLKKLTERRKRKLARLVPFEIRSVLMRMLDTEPSARPSANYALQLFRRPIELCKANEDSLRHLRRSLGYLETGRWFNNNTVNQPLGGGGNGAAHGRRLNYFRKVTSLPAAELGSGACGAPGTGGSGAGAGDEAPLARARQTKNLHLLNLFLRALDSLACSAAAATSAQLMGEFGAGQQQQAPLFPQLRHQFEFTFETLKLVYGLTRASGVPNFGHTHSGNLMAACRDSRFLMLAIVLHRRLLDQVAHMRAELPPVCRLAAANAPPAARQTANHRALAELEDRLQCLVSRHSLPRLAQAIADPLLKLEEFLLVYELVTDLLAFVGQKCRQSFVQRGKQLLNELTPVTGCPSLSSSDDEDSAALGHNLDTCTALGGSTLALGPSDRPSGVIQVGAANTSSARQPLGVSASTGAAAAAMGSRDTLNNYPSQTASISSRMSARCSDYETASTLEPGSLVARHRKQRSASQQPIVQPVLGQHASGANLPHTKISITAPSPRGSMREVNRASLAASSGHASDSSHQLIMGRRSAGGGGRSSAASDEQQMIERTSQLSLNGASAEYGGQSLAAQNDSSQLTEQQLQCELELDELELQAAHASQLAEQQDDNVRDHYADLDNYDHQHQCTPGTSAGSQAAGLDRATDRSRSQLIDELLRTINDDSFNDLVDFNNKFTAQTRQSAGDTARPHSAMESSSSGRTMTATGHQQREQLQSAGRPTSLALGASGPQHQQPAARGPAGTFDNVIRRMSTNFVQNFNKMGVGTGGSGSSSGVGVAAGSGSEHMEGGSVRREKSSAGYAANSLYVDNQVPARRHSDNTINIPRIQVALSSPQSPRPGGTAGGMASGTALNQRASVSASKLANKWKLSAKSNQGNKLSPNLSSALGYMRRHSSGNTTGNEQSQSNGQTGHLLLNTSSPFKTKSSSNLGLDFLTNRSMKRRYSAASMLGHQTQRKAEDLIDAGMKSVQNMFS